MKNTHVVDANVILRFLVGDHPEYFQKSSAFMAKVKAGEVNAYVPERERRMAVHLRAKRFSDWGVTTPVQ